MIGAYAGASYMAVLWKQGVGNSRSSVQTAAVGLPLQRGVCGDARATLAVMRLG